jgi:alginate O-acetyltransferase complex protein AlgI
MWIMGFSIYAGYKWLTWSDTLEKGIRPSTWLSLGYFIAWPGMDAQTFLDIRSIIPKPHSKAWSMAILETLSGAALLWGIARLIPSDEPLIVGWVGIAGLILLGFFGIFHINALIWQSLGVNAQPIMNSPALATSLTNFWGARWNLAVHKLVRELVFDPLVYRVGVAGAAFMAFLASGFAHELITSLPARGGYGLPITYFALQSLGVFLERSKIGRRFGLGRGLRGRVFAFIFTACPFFLLFHPPFITRVIIPFMRRIHAL